MKLRIGYFVLKGSLYRRSRVHVVDEAEHTVCGTAFTKRTHTFEYVANYHRDQFLDGSIECSYCRRIMLVRDKLAWIADKRKRK